MNRNKSKMSSRDLDDAITKANYEKVKEILEQVASISNPDFVTRTIEHGDSFVGSTLSGCHLKYSGGSTEDAIKISKLMIDNPLFKFNNIVYSLDGDISHKKRNDNRGDPDRYIKVLSYLLFEAERFDIEYSVHVKGHGESTKVNNMKELIDYYAVNKTRSKDYKIKELEERVDQANKRIRELEENERKTTIASDQKMKKLEERISSLQKEFF